jgi:hypothetical protein
MWLRIGSRSGPNRDKAVPQKLPAEGWDNERGQFIKHDNSEVVWRRCRLEKRFDKFQKKDTIDFYFYGPGYSDYECTKEVCKEAEFRPE